MSRNVTLVGTYAIPEGTVDERKAAIVGITDFVNASVPRLMSFDAYVSDETSEATSIYVHPDSASLEQQLEVAASRISAGVQLVQTRRIELYESPGDPVVEQLHRISEIPTGFPVTVKAHIYGSKQGGRAAGCATFGQPAKACGRVDASRAGNCRGHLCPCQARR